MDAPASTATARRTTPSPVRQRRPRSTALVTGVRGKELPESESTAQRRGMLAGIPLFAALDVALLAQVAAACETRRVGAGEFIVRAGEAARHLYAVVVGELELQLGSGDDDPAVLALVGPGDTIGEAAVWLGSCMSFSARATQDALLLAWPRPRIARLAARHPELAGRWLTCVARQAVALLAIIASHRQKSGEQRLADFLVGLPALGSESPEPRVRLPASKGTVASLVSIQPETLSRILRRFQENRWIRMHGRELTLVDPDALRRVADGSLPSPS